MDAHIVVARPSGTSRLIGIAPARSAPAVAAFRVVVSCERQSRCRVDPECGSSSIPVVVLNDPPARSERGWISWRRSDGDTLEWTCHASSSPTRLPLPQVAREIPPAIQMTKMAMRMQKEKQGRPRRRARRRWRSSRTCSGSRAQLASLKLRQRTMSGNTSAIGTRSRPGAATSPMPR